MALVECEKSGPVAVLTLNAPEARNAFVSPDLRAEFIAACDAVNQDRAVRVAILTGAGSAFSAGGDLKSMHRRVNEGLKLPHEIERDFVHGIHKVTRALYQLEVPLIAAINGPAVGVGLDLVCLCDMRIASERAKFAFSFVRLGLIPGDGGAWLLPRAVGRAVARELAFTGEMFDAEHAQRIGLVSRVVPHETLMEQALTLASRVSANAGSTLRLTKRLMRQAEDTTLEQALEAAASGQALAQYTVAHRTAVIAAAAKQTPSFGELD